MALLQLKDIGKIYVSDSNVAVGIRGVNLSFERGEFVAITGKSGSGKSTLLNVISGIDTYEEGELWIEGHPTSHYLQPDWEAYRQQYISFIFQDYNIIDSFTVLQNVELALMHIENKKERRARALELLERVGLSSHIHHKGSRLSGGQKQRTVIARALAKDSPIILADEPTGNLDSATSAEIIELLREIAKDKLLIMVTHNFEQVEHCATRHVRIYDGAVESDQILRPSGHRSEDETAEDSASPAVPPVRPKKGRDLQKGWTLGRSIFTSRPKLSVFLCLLLMVGAMGIFLITGYCGEAALLFRDYPIFTPMEGRVVVTTQDGTVPSNQTLASLAEKYGACDVLRYDSMLDDYNWGFVSNGHENRYLSFRAVYDKTYDGTCLGRYPTSDDEVLLYVPIYLQPLFGETELLANDIQINDGLKWKICGVQYYYDNNLEPEAVFTKQGLLTATAVSSVTNDSQMELNLRIRDGQGEISTSDYKLGICEGLTGNQVYVDLSRFDVQKSSATEVLLSIGVRPYRSSSDVAESREYVKVVDSSDVLLTLPSDAKLTNRGYTVYVSPEFLLNLYEEGYADSYRQASFFFENDRAAAKAVEGLKQDGYVAVRSDTEYEPSAMEMLENLMMGLMMAVLWLAAIVFLAFFINLCSFRTLESFKGDMAIMRSMGISAKVIRIGMYVRMLIALIPAYVTVILAGLFVFRSPTLNAYFVYLYPWQYVLIFAGLLLLTWRITHGQIRRLFRQSVKKSLRGGESE